MGKPVVSTDLPEVNTFNGQHGVLITSPNRTPELIASIESALLSSGEDALVNRRRAVASLNDWEGRCERMSHLIECELRKKVFVADRPDSR
jgi:hypothetical protein